jgi:hypothetical protein
VSASLPRLHQAVREDRTMPIMESLVDVELLRQMRLRLVISRDGWPEVRWLWSLDLPIHEQENAIMDVIRYLAAQVGDPWEIVDYGESFDTLEYRAKVCRCRTTTQPPVVHDAPWPSPAPTLSGAQDHTPPGSCS